jgi:hypothetical protein
MSLTGVLLTYERQMLASAARSQQPSPEPGASPRGLDELISASLRSGMAEPASILMYRDPAQPVEFRSGHQSVLVDRYTGENLGESAPLRLRPRARCKLAHGNWGLVRDLPSGCCGDGNPDVVFLGEIAFVQNDRERSSSRQGKPRRREAHIGRCCRGLDSEHARLGRRARYG